MFKFLNPNDPASKDIELWHFVYMHGEAERANQEQQQREGWSDREAPDYCVCADPKPTAPGAYYGELYGRMVICVLAHRHGGLDGRAAFIDDYPAVMHCNSPEDWR